MKIGDRAYHVAFGWGTITHYLPGSDGLCMDLDAVSISYYVMGKGYKQMNGKNGENIKTLYTTSKEVVARPENMEKVHHLLKMALNPTITYPPNYKPDHLLVSNT